MIYGIPILNKEWIDFIWDNRRTFDFNPADAEYEVAYKLKPFMLLKICLLNYSPDESETLAQAITSNAGEISPLGDGENTPVIAEDCSHLVIKDSQSVDFCSLLERSIHLPKYVVTDKVENM